MKNDVICTNKQFEAIKGIFEMYKSLCEEQSKNRGCDSCPVEVECRNNHYEKVLNFITFYEEAKEEPLNTYDYRNNLNLTLEEYINKLCEISSEDDIYAYEYDLMTNYFNTTQLMNTEDYMTWGAIVFEKEITCEATIKMLNEALSIDVDKVDLIFWENYSITVIGTKNNEVIIPADYYDCYESSFKISDKLTLKQIYDIFNSVVKPN